MLAHIGGNVVVLLLLSALSSSKSRSRRGFLLRVSIASSASSASALALSEKSSPQHASLPHRTSASACKPTHTHASRLIHSSDLASSPAVSRMLADRVTFDQLYLRLC